MTDIKKYITKHRHLRPVEVIVVADGCTNKTVDIVKKEQETFPELQLVTYSPNQRESRAAVFVLNHTPKKTENDK